MAEDLQSNLQNYQLQLQQVEAALLTDPSNEELIKLKTDLEEVIELTTDLIKTQLLEAAGSSTEKEVKAPKPQRAEEPDSPVSTAKQWKAGDKCLAIWSEDGQYYEATIEEITNGEDVSVIFDAYQNADVCNINLLREVSTAADNDKNKKHPMSKQREYQKKKKQKKLQRFKQLEEDRETEKNKWLAFATKKKGGCLKKSIFASPESVSGRVGIGTCGIGGKPMTEFSSAEKWRKGT
ncbi:Survival of motor neuron-related-splicing factor 30 [Frankliniella fusca]|uniref:Survival of motor neuron-related-splicing factor 30 n=1 Tax=Frankliniella fusca TaxID=407009 RepID=A0AAE1H0U9_9NEOP|nr:Survival of motor neuron-related-splicing factor 30 [Frankliniella fusca]